MIQKLRAKSLVALTVVLLFYILTFPSLAHAVCDDPDVTKRGSECPAGLDQIEAMVGNIFSLIVGIGFIAALVLLVWAGIKYLTSGGEPKAIQSAHSVTTWALLGILFMAIAWLALQLIEGFTGIKVTVFDIKALCGDGPNFPFCSPIPKP